LKGGSLIGFPVETEAGYQPVIGGFRHWTLLENRPPNGMVVFLLCGGQYQVGSRRTTPRIQDCSLCQKVWNERMIDQAEAS